jgi:hypothetical protein
VAETLTQRLKAEIETRTMQYTALNGLAQDLLARVKELEQYQGVGIAAAYAADLQWKINIRLGTSDHHSRFVYPYRGGVAVGPDQTQLGTGAIVPDEFIITRVRNAEVGKRMTRHAIEVWLEPATERQAA